MSVRLQDLKGSAHRQALDALAEINGKKAASGLRLSSARAQLPQHPPGSSSAPRRKAQESELELHLLRQIRFAGLPTPERQVRFAAPARQWRADFLWADAKIIAEVDGGTFIQGGHSRGVGYEQGAEKQNAAVNLGFRYFRFTKHMVEDGRALSTLTEALTRGNQ